MTRSSEQSRENRIKGNVMSAEGRGNPVYRKLSYLVYPYPALECKLVEEDSWRMHNPLTISSRHTKQPHSTLHSVYVCTKPSLRCPPSPLPWASLGKRGSLQPIIAQCCAWLHVFRIGQSWCLCGVSVSQTQEWSSVLSLDICI